MTKALDVLHKVAASGLVAATLFGVYTCVDGTRHIVRARQKEAIRMAAAGEKQLEVPKYQSYFK
jgi:uncharacterized membrane protein HdeD (DUF308 family)